MIYTGYHVHKRCFAATVLSEKRKDLAFVYTEAYVFVRNNAAESLSNVS